MKNIKIHVDGSYQPKINSSVAGWGFCIEGLQDSAVDIYQDSGVVHNPVSRQIDGEIQAVKEAIEWCKQNLDDLENTIITIYHDYEGLGKWADNLWKTNKPLTINYKTYISNARFSGLRIYFKWEKGHDNNFYNDIADRLATTAVKETIQKQLN